VPTEPPPTSWALQRPPDDHPQDMWAAGADLEPGTLLGAYRAGLFPMAVDGSLVWWSPPRRAVIPLERFHTSRSLRRSARRFEIRVDTAFVDVIRACADPARPHGWIDASFVEAYVRLHRLGWAHSVEAWDEEGLQGGVYGVAVGGLFAAESKFHHRTDASKAALLGLVELLRVAGAAGATEPRVLDVQWQTPHLASLGAVEITRAVYHRRLDAALRLPDAFEPEGRGPAPG
jgi:leucyl/phenylalanyl-tRNA--protein transferase